VSITKTESAATTTTIVTGEQTACAVATTLTVSDAATMTLIINNGRDGVAELHSFPASCSFFKAGDGFIALALWGHIPLHDMEQMLLHLFINVKAKTSFGRGTSTRSAMRKALIATSAAPLNNLTDEEKTPAPACYY
jgi:hypothetical protein